MEVIAKSAGRTTHALHEVVDRGSSHWDLKPVDNGGVAFSVLTHTIRLVGTYWLHMTLTEERLCELLRTVDEKHLPQRIALLEKELEALKARPTDTSVMGKALLQKYSGEF